MREWTTLTANPRSTLKDGRLKFHDRGTSGEDTGALGAATHCGGETSVRVGRRRRQSSRALRFGCRFCSYSSDKKTDVRVHERTHTGERPFHCHLCPRKFSHKSNLTKHLRCHSGEKPFRCPICCKSLGRKTDLRRHVAAHASESPDPGLVRRPRVAADAREEPSSGEELRSAPPDFRGHGERTAEGWVPAR